MTIRTPSSRPEEIDRRSLASLPAISERQYIHIVNPAAGGGRHLKAARTAVETTGGTLLESKHPGNLAELICENAARDPYAHFVIYGGDGTVFEAVNGIIRSGKNRTVSFSVIPAGSGNDFSAHVNDSGKLEKYALTPIAAVLTRSDGEERYYANMMNIGFDCNVVRATASLKKNPLFRGGAAYIAGAAKELVKKKTTDAEIVLENCVDPETGETAPARVFRQKILLTAAGNGSHCGGGFNSLPLAEADDGLLDVLVVNDVSRRTFVALVGDYRAGTYLDENRALKPPFREILRFIRCSRMTVKGPEYFCLDGEVFPTGEEKTVEAEVCPRCLLYVPA